MNFIKQILIILLLLILTGCKFWEISDGEKSGIIVKIAHQGLFIKTWEGELVRGGLNNGGGTIGKSFDFTIEDSQILELAKIGLNSQVEVKIYYKKYAFCIFNSDSECVFIYRIE